ncbi:LolA family protein [Bacillus sp. FJAT-45066]|uniref:LolA family protein n=1 Tax=Bacillus sp. FJAT-45066 TaxID=2011010 RepID=UPI0015970FC0|nr:outer membrane lipoprotein carrier protein LolA [Bacillus sp. FJAT-45066]
MKMLRKAWLLLVVGLVSVLLLAGCGAKSKEDVTAGLGKKVEEMTGYKANAKMTLQTGAEPQVYEVEISHKKPNYYKVNLKNAQKDQHQMIIRNDEGVFVLTPALNKSFRFQSEWPQNSSQAYLFESLVGDVVADPEAVFTATEEGYVFETKTNYQNNKLLPIQEITFAKDFSPVSVKVMDTDRNTLVLVEFSNVEFNPSFDADAFNVDKNMTGMQIELGVELPTMGSVSEEDVAFTVLIPGDTPAGSSLSEQTEVATENGKRVIMTYTGDKTFTLIQEKATVAPASTVLTVNGKPVDLDFAIGALTSTSIKWTYQGVDYMLASNDLSEEEMIMVAKSVQVYDVK